MKSLKYSRVLINAIIIVSAVIALTSGYKIGG